MYKGIDIVNLLVLALALGALGYLGAKHFDFSAPAGAVILSALSALILAARGKLYPGTGAK
jgi:hypothetical protein